MNDEKDELHLDAHDDENSSNENANQELHEDGDSVISNSSEDSTISNSSLETQQEPNVRRLSLFDTVNEDEKEDSLNKENDLRAEPVFSSSMSDEDINIEKESLKNDDTEISGEESEKTELDSEFNQETEELLDIPTFLRRQAN